MLDVTFFGLITEYQLLQKASLVGGVGEKLELITGLLSCLLDSGLLPATSSVLVLGKLILISFKYSILELANERRKEAVP